jgi:hypothetical protein
MSAFDEYFKATDKLMRAGLRYGEVSVDEEQWSDALVAEQSLQDAAVEFAKAFRQAEAFRK